MDELRHNLADAEPICTASLLDRNLADFERFTFETHGVESFGDLSYLLTERYEADTRSTFASARHLEWPGAWGGGMGKEAAREWVRSLPEHSATLLLYTREQYKEIARPLGIWAESQRATHNGTSSPTLAPHPLTPRTRPPRSPSPLAPGPGTILLRPPGGGTLLLADRRRCSYLPDALRIRPPPEVREVAAPAGVSCTAACRQHGGTCTLPTRTRA